MTEERMCSAQVRNWIPPNSPAFFSSVAAVVREMGKLQAAPCLNPTRKQGNVMIWQIETPEKNCCFYHKMSSLMTKPTKWSELPAKTQISLGIHAVWSEFSLSAWRNIGSWATHWVHSKDSDQTRQMPRLIWVFAGHTSFCWFCHAAAQMWRMLFYYWVMCPKIQTEWQTV